MNKTDFINTFYQVYQGIYSDQELKEINDLLYDLSVEQVDILYDYIRDNYSYKKLPGYNYIRKTCEKLRLIKIKTSVKLPDEVFKKTPLYQLENAKDWTAAAILDHVKFIRKKQDELWAKGLPAIHMKSEDISFMSIWDCLMDAKPEHLEAAKDRIVASGYRELHADTRVNLDDLMKSLIKVQNIENKKVVNEIPF